MSEADFTDVTISRRGVGVACSLRTTFGPAALSTRPNQLELALPGEILLAIGMGICNAAVFKLVPQEVPQAIGGAAGWVGGLGAFGGFVLPPVMAFAVRDLGRPGYAIGFVVFIFLALSSLATAWILKYSHETAPGPG